MFQRRCSQSQAYVWSHGTSSHFGLYGMTMHPKNSMVLSVLSAEAAFIAPQIREATLHTILFDTALLTSCASFCIKFVQLALSVGAQTCLLAMLWCHVHALRGILYVNSVCGEELPLPH